VEGVTATVGTGIKAGSEATETPGAGVDNVVKCTVWIGAAAAGRLVWPSPMGRRARTTAMSN